MASTTPMLRCSKLESKAPTPWCKQHTQKHRHKIHKRTCVARTCNTTIFKSCSVPTSPDILGSSSFDRLCPLISWVRHPGPWWGDLAIWLLNLAVLRFSNPGPWEGKLSVANHKLEIKYRIKIKVKWQSYSTISFLLFQFWGFFFHICSFHICHETQLTNTKRKSWK